MEFIYNDGGRSVHFKGQARDCVVRAIAIFTERPYMEIYELVNEFAKKERPREGATRSSAREGVHTATTRKVLAHLGAVWTPTMGIGTGCRVHLKADEIPSGRIIVNLSLHLSAVIDGVVHDTHDPSRDETRCVYGYWKFPEK